MSQNLTHWKKLTNPNYLGSWDFRENEERTLTIKNVSQEEVFNPTDNSKKFCTVAHFKENSKPMVLNKTNCKTISELYKSNYIEDWAGCRVIIRVEKVRAFGKLEEGLRIKKQLPSKPSLPKTNEKSFQEETLFCGDCGEIISAYDKYSDKQIADHTLKRYGIQLCASCSNKRKEVS